MNDIAKELRMGNIHYSEEFSHPRLGIGDVKVDGRSYAMITSYGIHMVAIGGMTFDPIPLSNDWLVKLGFQYNDLNGDDGYWQIKSSIGIFEILNGKDGFYYEHKTEVKHVHQLQNLFFALTGKELETT